MASNPPCGPGYIVSMRFLGNGHTVIKLDTVPQENYTTKKEFQKPLFDAFVARKKIVLFTETCTRSDYGFDLWKIADE